MFNALAMLRISRASAFVWIVPTAIRFMMPTSKIITYQTLSIFTTKSLTV
jgi:hypothetical protein